MRIKDLSIHADMGDHLEEAQALIQWSLKCSDGVVAKTTNYIPSERAIDLRFLFIIHRDAWRRRQHRPGARHYVGLSVDYADQAMATLANHDPLLSAGVDNLSLAYYARYLHAGGKVSDMDVAVSAATRGVDLGAHNYSNIQRPP